MDSLSESISQLNIKVSRIEDICTTILGKLDYIIDSEMFTCYRCKVLKTKQCDNFNTHEDDEMKKCKNPNVMLCGECNKYEAPGRRFIVNDYWFCSDRCQDIYFNK